jgi:hypothetical protein
MLGGGRSMAAGVTRLGQWAKRDAKHILGVLFFIFGIRDLLEAIAQ